MVSAIIPNAEYMDNFSTHGNGEEKMKISTTIIASALLIAMLSVSCCLSGKEKKLFAFSDRERQWFVYKQSDTLVFTSNSAMEMLTVTKVENDTVPRHEKFGGCDIIETEMMAYSFQKVGEMSSNFIYLFFWTDEFGASFEWNNFSAYKFNEFPTKTFQIGNQTFVDCWEHSIQASSGVVAMTYSKSAGILKYKYADGREFTRVLN